jgi:hypothetical protein
MPQPILLLCTTHSPDEKSKNISYLLCFLKKIKIECIFIGFVNKKYNRIDAKYCIHRDKLTSDFSIFGFNRS